MILLMRGSIMHSIRGANGSYPQESMIIYELPTDYSHYSQLY
jgi:hypothetical protein